MSKSYASRFFRFYNDVRRRFSTRIRRFFGAGDSVKNRNSDFEFLYERLAESLNDSFHTSYGHTETEKKSSSKKAGEGKDGKRSSEGSDLNVDSLVRKTNENFEDTFSEVLSFEMSRGVLRQIEQQYQAGSGYERFFDNALTNLRWVAAWIFLASVPIILGIIVILLGESWLMLSKSVEFFSLAWSGNSGGAKDMLADLYGTVLSMLDMMLISALVMMVTIGGYENTVSRIGLNHAYPRWFGKLDIGELKIKVAASIATISSIHLLLNFMMIDSSNPEEFDPQVIMWTAIVHVIFVVSALVLAFMNRISHSDHEASIHLKRDKKAHDGKEEQRSSASEGDL